MPRKFLSGLLVVGCSLALLLAIAAPQARDSTAEAESDFLPALPGYRFSFPRDHGAHPDFQTEWWYYTGHLQADEGNRFGYELTFFRFGMVREQPPDRSSWAVRDVNFAHFAITDLTRQKYFFDDRMERANMGLAYTTPGQLNVWPRLWIDNWMLDFAKNGAHHLSAQALAENHATPRKMAIQLTQTAQKPPVINGQNGISRKGPSRYASSHYYSMPRLETTGTLTLDDKTYRVSGQSWLDREFGSGGLSPGQRGWDWFAIQLDDGRDLMLYQIREKDGAPGPYSAGTLTDQNGNSTFLRKDDFQITVLDWWNSPRTGARYPARWDITLGAHQIDLRITPNMADQEMRPRRERTYYWEGSCRVDSKSTFTPAGKAYVELTGYEPKKK